MVAGQMIEQNEENELMNLSMNLFKNRYSGLYLNHTIDNIIIKGEVHYVFLHFEIGNNFFYLCNLTNPQEKTKIYFDNKYDKNFDEYNLYEFLEQIYYIINNLNNQQNEINIII